MYVWVNDSIKNREVQGRVTEYGADIVCDHVTSRCVNDSGASENPSVQVAGGWICNRMECNSVHVYEAHGMGAMSGGRKRTLPSYSPSNDIPTSSQHRL